MYLNTTYKAFVAKTAAGLMQEMVAEAMANDHIDNQQSWDDNKLQYEHLAYMATQAAKELAKALENDWEGRDGRQTVFFDVQDSQTSRLENAISDVAGKIQELTDGMKAIADR